MMLPGYILRTRGILSPAKSHEVRVFLEIGVEDSRKSEMKQQIVHLP